MSLWYVWRKPSSNLALTLTLSQNKSKQDSTWPTSSRSSIRCLQYYFWAYSTFDAKRAPIFHRRKHCLKTDRNEIPYDPRHLGVPSDATNTIFEPTVRSTQTMHQSCIKSSTISKLTEPNFHLSLVTQESHRMRPKQFLCRWYVRCKPCTYLALTLTLSPNWLKWYSTRPTSLTSTIGCIQNYWWAYGTFSANCAPISCHD
jgi:hypothetical protein